MNKTRRAAAAPTDAVSAGWANLPATLFDLCAQLLLTDERRTCVEHVCVRWHAQSSRGLGWSHSLDLSALPPAADWRVVCERLKGRLLPRRIVHLRCYHSALKATAVAAAAAVPLLDFPASSDDRQSDGDGRCDNDDDDNEDVGDNLCPADIPVTRDRLAGQSRTAGTSVPAILVFARCKSLVLASIFDHNADSNDMSHLCLQATFPQATRLHVAIDVPKATVATVCLATALSDAAELGGDAEDVSAAVGVATSAMQKRVAWMSRVVDSNSRWRYVTHPARLPNMSRIQHLSVTAGAPVSVELRGALPALQSLYIEHPAALMDCGLLEVPCLTRIVLGNMTPGKYWRALIDAAHKTLTTLVDVCLFREDVLYLKRCEVLRRVHYLCHESVADTDMASHVEGLAAIPSLLDGGVYTKRQSDFSVEDMIGASVHFRQHAHCKRLTIADLSRRDDSDPAEGMKGLTAAFPSWRFTPIDNIAQTQLVLVGVSTRQIRDVNQGDRRGT